MKRQRLFGGIAFLIAAGAFLLSGMESSLPIGLALALVGIALLATERRRGRPTH